MENPNPTPSAAQQAENNGSGRTFTKDEVNSIVADRLARERSKSAERAGDLDALEKDLKAREEALEAKSQRFNQWEAREACKQYLTITISARRCWISWTPATRKRSRLL